jgi:hypothetical protein
VNKLVFACVRINVPGGDYIPKAKKKNDDNDVWPAPHFAPG